VRVGFIFNGGASPPQGLAPPPLNAPPPIQKALAENW